MDVFSVVQDSCVILRSKGVYRQEKVYQRGDRLYAGYGKGFIRLGGKGFTTCPNVTYESLDVPFETQAGATGEPLVPQATVTPIKAAA